MFKLGEWKIPSACTKCHKEMKAGDIFTCIPSTQEWLCFSCKPVEPEISETQESLHALLLKAMALKDRLIKEKRFDEATKIRDLIHAVEEVGRSIEAIERLVKFYESEPVNKV